MTIRDRVAAYLSPMAVGYPMLAAAVVTFFASWGAVEQHYVSDGPNVTTVDQWAVIPWLVITVVLLIVMLWLADHPRHRRRSA